MSLEYSLVLMKPDAVVFSLTGELISHLEREDLHIVVMKAVEVDQQLASAHYFEHRRRPYFKDIVKYLMGGYHSFPWVYAFAYCGEGACQKIRDIIGRTDPMDIEPGKKIITLRQKYGRNVIVRDDAGNEIFDEEGHVVVRFENVIHASYSNQSEYEIKLWFEPCEILSSYRLFPVKADGKGGITWETPAAELREQLFSQSISTQTRRSNRDIKVETLKNTR